MKLLKFEIKDDSILEITCKRPAWYKSYLEEVEKVIEDMRAKDLGYKYYGWHFDIDKNIVFTFKLFDYDKDVKPYLKYTNVGGKL